MRKIFALMASGAAVVALATAVMASAASADTFYKCPTGTSYLTYCTAVKICVVPSLRGDTPGQAKRALLRHDCTLDAVKGVVTKNGPYGVVLFSSPPAGSIRNRGWSVVIFVSVPPPRHHR